MNILPQPYYDGVHLVCHSFSIEGLHKVSRLLGIKYCHYHYKPRLPHYDVPRYLQKIVRERSVIVSSKDIIRIIRGEY